MNKFKTFLLFLLASVFALSVQAIEQDKGYVSVNQSLTKEVLPSQAEISISVETSGLVLQNVADENKNVSARVYASLKALLSPQDTIKTTDYSVKPQYIYNKENKRIFDKYIVSNTVLLKTKKLDSIALLIDTAVSQGATNISNLQFSAQDYEIACNEALSELTKQAFSKAGTVASSINAKVSGIKSINTSCSQSDSQRPYYEYAAKTLSNYISSTPVESGKVKIYASVDASFYVK